MVSKTIPCPFCAEQIQASAKKCKHCGESANPTSPSVAGPLHIDLGGGAVWSIEPDGEHNHNGAVPTQAAHGHKIVERGATVYQVTTTSLKVRPGNYIGINEAGTGWLTSGYYKVVAWA